MRDFSLRTAIAEDASELAILDDIASSGLASWLWYDGVVSNKSNTAMERGRQIMANPNIHWGYTNAVIANIGSEMAGMAISYKMNMSETSPDMGETANAVLKGCFELMALVNDQWYLDGLAVYRQFRGQGLGKKLIENTKERARESGVAALTLITENNNETALGLYHSQGFKIIDQRPYVPFGQQTGVENWVLLSAPLN